MGSLNDRERFIVQERKLREDPRTLESLGGELGLSKERVRQLEAAAFGKMRKTSKASRRKCSHSSSIIDPRHCGHGRAGRSVDPAIPVRRGRGFTLARWSKAPAQARPAAGDPSETGRPAIVREMRNPALMRQARAVAALQPAALVFEMLSPSQAEAATGAVRRDRAALAAALGWVDSGWPDFGMYFPTFSAAHGRRGGQPGAAVPSPDIRQASADPAAAAFGQAAARFGLDEPLPGGEQAAREARQARAHCDALPETALLGMVEVQRLRDAHFARPVACSRRCRRTQGMRPVRDDHRRGRPRRI